MTAPASAAAYSSGSVPGPTSCDGRMWRLLNGVRFGASRPRLAAQYKRASIAGISALGALLLRSVPELGEPDAFRLAGAAVMTTAALWPHTQPSAAMLAAYAADPALAAMRLDFTATLREVLEVLTAGLLARRR